MIDPERSLEQISDGLLGYLRAELDDPAIELDAAVDGKRVSVNGDQLRRPETGNPHVLPQALAERDREIADRLCLCHCRRGPGIDN